jgi:hypothetical protein
MSAKYGLNEIVEKYMKAIEFTVILGLTCYINIVCYSFLLLGKNRLVISA